MALFDIPNSYNVNLDIDDSDIFKIGLVVYIAMIGLLMFKKKGK